MVQARANFLTQRYNRSSPVEKYVFVAMDSLGIHALMAAEQGTEKDEPHLMSHCILQENGQLAHIPAKLD
jgi:hypothetical protein